METKFNMSLDQAKEILSLNTNFTEKEFRTNYKKLIMNIHPDVLGDINPIARKLLEDEAKRVNIAKGVIESYLKGKQSDYNVNRNNRNYRSENNNTHEQQKRQREYEEQQKRQREYEEQQKRQREYEEQQKRQREHQRTHEKYQDRHKVHMLNRAMILYYTVLFFIGLGVYLLNENGYSLTSLGLHIFISLFIIPIFILVILIITRRIEIPSSILTVYYILWFLSAILISYLLNKNEYSLTKLGRVTFGICLLVLLIIFIFNKDIEDKKYAR